MKFKFIALCHLLSAICLSVSAQGTAFTYQGRLDNGTNPASGSFDLTFSLYNASSGGAQTGNTVTNTAVGVSNGLFTATMDFGAMFNGTAYWLQIGVRTNGASAFAALSPRQALTPTPYSITAENVTGTIPLAQLPATVALISDPGTENFFAGLNAGGSAGGGSFNVGIGQAALQSVTSFGYYNEAIGAGALYADTSGSDNAANGCNALASNTNGSSNTADGMDALYSNRSGNNNTATGTGALYGNTTANNNTADGSYALAGGNVTGGGNTGSGANALSRLTSGYNNTAVGLGALYSDSTGVDNVAMGVSAFYNLPGGSQNTGVGTYAFQNLTNGSLNVGLGYYAGNALFNGSGNIYIGNAGLAADNNVIRIGDAQTQTYIAGTLQGNIAINGGLNLDSTGQNTGHVTANALTFGASSGEGIASQRSGGSTASGLYGLEFYTDYATQMTILQNGNVGIGTTSPTQVLEVNGNYVLVDGGAADNGNGSIQAYIGGSGSGSEVQIGSLNAKMTGVAFWNQTSNAWMHISCSSITIKGGADLAEPFPISSTEQKVSEGAVVVIDEANPGQLKLADQPYDTRVAGVVSGANGVNPGIQMQQQGLLEGGRNVALTGRVYVQADASNGAIKPGDLLTTSSTLGRAMKVSDHAKAQGAILGKAMTALNEGNGMVLVLVTLQ